MNRKGTLREDALLAGLAAIIFIELVLVSDTLVAFEGSVPETDPVLPKEDPVSEEYSDIVTVRRGREYCTRGSLQRTIVEHDAPVEMRLRGAPALN